MKIKLSESKLKQIVAESVKKILSEARKPSDKTVGKHTLKGLRYDKNGNPLYTSDTMSDDEKKIQGWKFSKKHGMYGQLSDPTKLSENELKQIVAESVKKVLMENDDFKPHGYKGTSNWGGYEMQISDRGDEARLRDSHTGKVSDWLEIQFDENGVAYVIDVDGSEERLCDYMRY